VDTNEIIRVNEKGEVYIPQNIRDLVGIVEGMHVIVRADVERRVIQITPFTADEVDLVEFKITLGDIPGALAKCATFLGNYNINLVASEARTIQKGELAEWIVVADISKCKCNIRDLCKQFVAEGYAKNAICRSFH